MDLRISRQLAAVPASLLLGHVPAHLCIVAAVVCLVLGASAQQAPLAACTPSEEARRFIGQQEWGRAAHALRLSVDEHPACPDARYLLGYVLLRANQPDASLQEYSAAAKLRPPNSDDFTAVASDYILLKSYADAEHWLLRAVATIPTNPQAWYLLGRTQYNLDRNAAAAESFKHSLAVLPEDPRSEYNLGLAYERLQQPDLARAAYQTAIRWGEMNHARDAQPYLDLGILIRSQKHADEALPFLKQAAALSPSNPLILQELGRTLSELNHCDEAITVLKKAVALAPSAESPHFFLGRAYRAAGRIREATEQFAIVQQLAGSHSSGTTPNADTNRHDLSH